MKSSRFIYLVVTVVFVAALLPLGVPVQAQSGDTPEITGDSQFVPGELVVGFQAGLTNRQMNAKASALAGSVGAQVASAYDNMALFSLAPDADLDAAADRLRSQVGVLYVERNYIRRVPQVVRGNKLELTSIQRKLSNGDTLTVDLETLKAMRTQVKVGGKVRAIPTYPANEETNWGNYRIGHDIIWPEKAASPWVCVADTGVDYKHPDLYPRVVNGKDFINDDGTPNDDYGHGTHVAGTIVGKLGNTQGPAGISNGKVLAVKVLNAQGWGTDFDVASGIRYCANNIYVKVINLSLGGGAPGYTLYSALQYAVNTKGKLVVAAAGNSSTSSPEYPAAWAAEYIGGMAPDGGPAVNNIHQGVLSVGAATPYSQWVNTNGNGTEDDGEHFDGCAAYFSNYGRWVEIVAPGEDIWSTLPVSYPFYGSYYYGDLPKYASWSGTSMATPHVAAAAARTWSIRKALNNSGIHDLLLSSGEALELQVDPNVIEPSDGFNDLGYPEDAAPFCWPNDTSPFTPQEDMSSAVYLNVAMAMDRGVIWARAFDSTTGLPLQGAKVQAVDAATRVVKDTALMAPPLVNSWADLINLPASATYNLRISKAGYTYGYQTFDYSLPVFAGWITFDPYMGVAAVPPKTSRISVVAQWRHDDYPLDPSDGAGDIDLYLWLPDGKQFIVGPEKYNHNPAEPYGYNPKSEVGTLVSVPGGFSPYARYQRDGGWPGGYDYRNIETIEIKTRSGYAYYPGEYKIFLTNNAGTGSELNNAWPMLTIWANGKIIGWNFQGIEAAGVCGNDETWWYGGVIKQNRFAWKDECGTTAILPYWIAP